MTASEERGQPDGKVLCSQGQLDVSEFGKALEVVELALKVAKAVGGGHWGKLQRTQHTSRQPLAVKEARSRVAGNAKLEENVVGPVVVGAVVGTVLWTEYFEALAEDRVAVWRGGGVKAKGTEGRRATLTGVHGLEEAQLRGANASGATAVPRAALQVSTLSSPLPFAATHNTGTDGFTLSWSAGSMRTRARSLNWQAEGRRQRVRACRQQVTHTHTHWGRLSRHGPACAPTSCTPWFPAPKHR